jgi:hypothetical protein
MYQRTIHFKKLSVQVEWVALRKIFHQNWE